MKQVLVRFSKTNNHNDCYDLYFNLENNSFVPKWIDRVNHAKRRQDPISEPWAMRGLNNNLTPEKFLNELNKNFTMTQENGPDRPDGSKVFGMYIWGNWKGVLDCKLFFINLVHYCNLSMF